MFEAEIPAMFWMVVVSILTLFLALILYYTAMFVRELVGATSEMRLTMNKVNKIVDETGEIVTTVKEGVEEVKESVSEVNETLMKPVRNLGGIFQVFGNFVQGAKGDSTGSEKA